MSAAADVDEAFGHNEKTSTLLVEPALRKKYEMLYAVQLGLLRVN